MITILSIGVVIAVGVIALVAKTLLIKPAKAKKSEKAAIMKQLLALSETESSMPSVAQSSVRTPPAVSGIVPGKRSAKRQRKPVLSRHSQQVHSSARPC
jgi:hypothetical protein